MSRPAHKFDMSEAWQSTVALLCARPIGALILAGIFLFFPQFLLVEYSALADIAAQYLAYWRGEQAAPSGADIRQGLAQSIPYLIIYFTTAVFGWLSMTILWLGGEKITVRLALISTFELLVLGFICAVIVAFAVGLGVLLFVLPALYIYARLFPIYGCVAMEEELNPSEIIKNCWRLTAGNGWRIFLFIFLALVVAAILVWLVSTGFALAVGNTTLANLMSALLNSLVQILMITMAASTYSQLTKAKISGIADMSEDNRPAQ